MELLLRFCHRKFHLLRNIGIIAHIDAGKTTTTERLIYRTGLTKRAGSVDNGDTVMDYLPEERERGITITSAAITLPWKVHRLNLIDTPGHVDFTVEVERSLRVMDGAVVILDASKGVQAQTLTVWRQARRHGLKSFIYINKMDKVGADLGKCLQDIRKHFDLEPILLNEPLFEGEQFTNVKDTSGDDSVKEKIAQYDDEFLEKYVESVVDQVDVKSAMKRITAKGDEAIAVLIGSSAKDIGTENVLDAIVDFLPAPIMKESEKDFKALAFKVVFDPKRNGFLVYCRVYSGQFSAKKQGIFNLSKGGKREQVGKIMQVMADEMIEIDSASAGQVVILTGLKHTATGDTLSTSSDESQEVLEGIKVPSPVISVSLEAESPSSQDHLDKCLEIVQLEDPSVQVRTDKTTGQTILSGMGELHLEIIESRLSKEMKAQFNTGPIAIAYQEAFVEVFGEFKKLLDLDREVFGIKLKGSVVVTVSEGPEEIEIRGDGLDENVKESVRDAVSSAFGRGPIGGHRVQRNCKILIEDLEFSTPNSAHVVVFEALQSLLNEAAEVGSIKLQEPLVKVEIDAPEQFIGDLTTDLFSGRRCVECESFGDGRIWARAPLRKMLGYSSWLRSRTGGMAAFTMEASGYTNFTE